MASSDQTLGVEDSVGGVDGDLVLGRVSNQPLGISEGDIGGGGALTLIIRDDLNLRTNKDFYKYCSGFYNKRLSEANYYVVVCSRVWRPGTVLRGRPGTMTCSTLGTADKETLC